MEEKKMKNDKKYTLLVKGVMLQRNYMSKMDKYRTDSMKGKIPEQLSNFQCFYNCQQLRTRKSVPFILR